MRVLTPIFFIFEVMIFNDGELDIVMIDLSFLIVEPEQLFVILNILELFQFQLCPYLLIDLLLDVYCVGYLVIIQEFQCLHGATLRLDCMNILKVEIK